MIFSVRRNPEQWAAISTPCLRFIRQRRGKPRWYIRPSAPILGPDGAVRSQQLAPVYLGLVSEMGKREAEKARDAYCQTLNRTPAMVQAQVKFGDLLDSYEQGFVPTLTPPSQNTYRIRSPSTSGPRSATPGCATSGRKRYSGGSPGSKAPRPPKSTGNLQWDLRGCGTVGIYLPAESLQKDSNRGDHPRPGPGYPHPARASAPARRPD